MANSRGVGAQIRRSGECNLEKRDMLRGNHIPLTNLTAPSLALDHFPQFLVMAMLVGGFWEIKPIKLKYPR